MVSPEKPQETLQQRINDLLHDNPLGYAVETPQQEATAAIFSLLQSAEEDLKAAQERVDRLKRDLEKARSLSAPKVKRPLT